ncbi:hypothetical protein [Sulfitobacter sp. R18_1]|uniref:hypothetical protein n=1 Tax=Sulfitobacter sp. R18_1 TaxID=2821104 RepID=UPI001ADA45EE|nr:hypothetical protein [Sulfitobacter sp. R18_1]MBO9428418.1 hypothetical protein [Sulfitobacter sp. R18_1]
MKNKVSTIVLVSGLIALGNPSYASYLEHVRGQEGGNYDQFNILGESSALGAYQFLCGTAEDLGYIRRNGSSCDWNTVSFTDRARAHGVNDLNSFRYGQSAISVQDQMMFDFTQRNWRHIENNGGINAVGRVVNGVTINEASLLTGAHFMGAGALNEWARGGLTLEALRNHSGLQAIMNANSSYPTVEALHAYLINRMAAGADADVSQIINGEMTPGGGTYVEESIMSCSTEVADEMGRRDEEYVQAMVAAAQDTALGYSQPDMNFSEMSCIDFAFAGGLDVFFSTPSLADIASQATDMACDTINSHIAEATGSLQGAMGEAASFLSSDGVDFGPFGNYFGVQVQPSDSWSVRTGSGGVSTPGINVGGTGGGLGSAGGTFNPGGEQATIDYLTNLFEESGEF